MPRANRYYESEHWRQLRRACIARAGGRCAVPGCQVPGKVVDHIVTRPPVPYPTELDRLDNVRLLCLPHDSQIKEKRRGNPDSRRGGHLLAKGCGPDGWPRGIRPEQNT